MGHGPETEGVVMRKRKKPGKWESCYIEKSSELLNHKTGRHVTETRRSRAKKGRKREDREKRRNLTTM